MDKKEYNRQYYLKHKQKFQKKNIEYRKTPEGWKSFRIGSWKHKGLIDDYEKVFEIYMETTECMRCSVPISGRGKHMDHDHETGLYRAILCRSCNNGNPLDLDCRKNNKSTGIKYISKRKNGYGFHKTTKGVSHRKYFKTIEEAVKYKDNYLKLP